MPQGQESGGRRRPCREVGARVTISREGLLSKVQAFACVLGGGAPSNFPAGVGLLTRTGDLLRTDGRGRTDACWAATCRITYWEHDPKPCTGETCVDDY